MIPQNYINHYPEADNMMKTMCDEGGLKSLWFKYCTKMTNKEYQKIIDALDSSDYIALRFIFKKYK
jgi:hypothetical protein